MTQTPDPAPSDRIVSIDVLRGVVMALMALDHARDFFGNALANPTNLAATTPALFMTRWATHFCAPVFVFLAGTSAWFYGRRVQSRRKLATFLFTRGLLLVVLEFSVVNFGWLMTFERLFFFQVIAAIGCAMMALAAIIWLPFAGTCAVGLAIVAGHNALDSVTPADFGDSAFLWVWLHEGFFASGIAGSLFGKPLWVLYPLLPWIGVITCGYCFGAYLTWAGSERRKRTLQLGLGLIVLFVVLRAPNLYGDPFDWTSQSSGLMTFFSFINCQKYPPSLLFLCMTLGPALVLLAALERTPGPVMRAVTNFGRVPLFFYVAHIYLLHLSSVLLYRVHKGETQLLESVFTPAYWNGAPEWYAYSLPVVYAAWIGAVLVLYVPCRWFAGVKRRNRSVWLSYL